MKWMQIEFHREFFMLVHHSDETILHLLFLEKVQEVFEKVFDELTKTF